jgi:hypothetical protein
MCYEGFKNRHVAPDCFVHGNVCASGLVVSYVCSPDIFLLTKIFGNYITIQPK